jgi:hypothetical protein
VNTMDQDSAVPRSEKLYVNQYMNVVLKEGK